MGHRHQGQRWGCGIATAPGRNTTAGSKIIHQERGSNCLWVVTYPCSSPKAIHTGNSCEELTYTPQQDIARAVCKQGPTALLGLQGRRNREKPSMKHWGKLRMQRTNPLSGGCATAASPLRSQHASSRLQKEPAAAPLARTPGLVSLTRPEIPGTLQTKSSLLGSPARRAHLCCKKEPGWYSLPERWLLSRNGICLSKCRGITL